MGCVCTHECLRGSFGGFGTTLLIWPSDFCFNFGFLDLGELWGRLARNFGGDWLGRG